MNLKNFFLGRTIGTILLFAIIGIFAGVYVFSNYMNREKLEQNQTFEETNKSPASTFAWKFEQADSLNPDGNPNTNVFLEVKYENGVIQNKLIDTTAGSCNDLPDAEADSVPNTTNIQCYSAGLGFKFKITKGETAYQIKRLTFEEASPDYTPPAYEYEVIAEIPFSI